MSSLVTFIVGCTASGKAALGYELARRAGGEIVSLDSMKVYRRMDIGTAKPGPDARRSVPHHLIDVVEPSEEFSVARYVELADQAIAGIQARGPRVFVVGGTPLYLKALTEGMFGGPGADVELRERLKRAALSDGGVELFARLQRVDPRAAQRIHPNDLRRVVRAIEVFELTGSPISDLQAQWDQQRTRYNCVLFGLRRSREDQSRRTNERVQRMIDAGLFEEVRSLLEEPRPLSHTARKALGYAEMIEHLEGRCTLDEAIEAVKIHTRHFAKAQRTWLRRFRELHWIDVEPGASVEEVACEVERIQASPWSPSPK